MIEALRFVKGAVATKDFVPELTHFRIGQGMVRGYNGEISLCSPINLTFDVMPKALPFIKAIESCDEAAKLHVTDSGRLAIESGKFRAYVECLPPEQYPDVYPEGERVAIEFDLVGVLKKLNPFIAEDASRPWARGILLNQQSAYATNNIIVIEHWLPVAVPTPVNIPKDAVREIIRIGENPTAIQVSETSISFHYENGSWLRSQLYDLSWPDVRKILPIPENYELTMVPPELEDNLAKLAPMVGEQKAIVFDGAYMSTSKEPGVGAMLAMPDDCPPCGVYNVKQLQLAASVMTHVDWTPYPRPAVFFGPNIRGAIIGMRG